MNKFLKSISKDKISLTMFIMWLVIFVYDCFVFNRIDLQKEFNFGYVGSGYFLAIFLAMILAFFQMAIIGVLFLLIETFIMKVIKHTRNKENSKLFSILMQGFVFAFFYGLIIYYFFYYFMFIGYFTK